MIKLRQLFKHDKMAFSRRKRLMCHYCNSKSDLTYDGKISQWECRKCDAVNYLDENGEITDPVVSSDCPTPPPTRYAIASSYGPLDLSHDSNIFCNLCLKNQHLYTSSLAQYHADLDVDNSDEDENIDAYNKFRRDLERRYPQVCEKCEPAALQRLRKAGKTAKADHLRRLMEKSRVGRFNKTKKTIFITDLLGKTLWKVGLSGQLVWSFMNILHATFCDIFSQSESKIYSAALEFVKQIIAITTSRKWAYSVLLCTVFSTWWCPKYKEFNKGFTKQISGLRNWYSLQVAVTFLRITFYLLMDTRFLSSDPFSAVTTGAHLVMSLLTILISIRANGFLKVRTTPLWMSDSEKISLRPQTPLDEEQESMDDILNNIALSSKKSSAHLSTSIQKPVGETHLLADMSELEVSSYLQTRRLPDRLTYEEMDWQSTQDHNLTFNLNPKTGISQVNNRSTLYNPQPFWCKIPAAPNTPAHKLRNPISQVNFQISPKKSQPNFFQGAGQTSLNHSKSTVQNKLQTGEYTKHNLELSQPKFFPPETRSESEIMLADLLDEFSLNGTETKKKNPSSSTNFPQTTLNFLLAGATLFLSFALYFLYRVF
ncbi:hypothetical protein GcM3_005025 [Golovinomyces cichoracearum]|uniref:Ima1 N-terminal domain-containing protein n=1 Tax=Golovinomyces cichoracearum TaxID=62708 RepID=A0A420JAV4_9PEZI|nr:hypothetical protein GcM3_005025 [Golovinomyces cichoracearum]